MAKRTRSTVNTLPAKRQKCRDVSATALAHAFKIDRRPPKRVGQVGPPIVHRLADYHLPSRRTRLKSYPMPDNTVSADDLPNTPDPPSDNSRFFEASAEMSSFNVDAPVPTTRKRKVSPY